LGEAEVLGAFVHQPDERGLGAGNPLGEHQRRVIARFYQQAAQQIFDARATLDVQEHRGRMAMRAPGAPRVFGDGVFVVEMDASGA